MIHVPSKNCHIQYSDIVYWAEFAVNPIFKEVKKQCERLMGLKANLRKAASDMQAATFHKTYFIQWNIEGSFEITPR